MDREALAADAAYTLPNGERVAQRHRYETDFLYREIFVDRIYARHGIELPPGARVVDIGANIGMFSLFIKLECPSARVYAFEPARELFALAQRNLERFGGEVRLYPLGVSDTEKVTEFTYYPGYSIMSGFHAAFAKDREVLAQGVKNQLEAAARSKAPVTQRMVDALVGKKLDGAERYECELVSLSTFIARERLPVIDLLKIDAERCEREILQGIAGNDWPKVRQVVVEAHDRPTAEQLEGLLVERGFRVVAEQESQFAEAEIFNLYARRDAA
jgi:FkbM family methyltransferase